MPRTKHIKMTRNTFTPENTSSMKLWILSTEISSSHFLGVIVKSTIYEGHSLIYYSGNKIKVYSRCNKVETHGNMVIDKRSSYSTSSTSILFTEFLLLLALAILWKTSVYHLFLQPLSLNHIKLAFYNFILMK